mmetsp:Transcript_4443/g.11286  ORF Transcript_4443/g.11286 Transcript_4443/m.11286 type:complete len:583 (-) Transcript_4443:100-1848(-)
MALLLSKLNRAVDAVRKSSEGGPIKDGSEELIKLCMLIEDIFNYNIKSKTSLLGDFRGYWGYFAECLDGTSAMVAKVNAISSNKTFVGKGRALIRCSLSSKVLAENVQIACRNSKSTAQHYHRNSILRDEQLSAQFVDILYNLNELNFQLDRDMGLDDAWPAFSVKSFTARHGPLNTESDTRSLLSTLSIDAEKSIEQLRDKVGRLRAEVAATKAERDTAMDEKNESDIAWNELVTKLKLEAFAATEECERATKVLAPVQSKCDQLNAAHAELRSRIDATQAALESLLPPALKGTHGGDISAEQLAKEIRSFNEAQVAAFEAERLAARGETDKLREQLDKARADVQLQVQVHEEQLRQKTAELKRVENRAMEAEGRHAEALAAVRQRHDVAIKALAAELESVQLRQTEATAELAQRTASLQETERNRSSTVDHLAHLEGQLEKETARAEAAMSDRNMLRNALTTATTEKHALCHRIQELSELLKTAKGVVLSTWQNDATISACTCGKRFTFSERKHHCRKCGQVYCDTCTPRKVLQSCSEKPERLCNSCFDLIESFRAENFDSVNSSFLRSQYESLGAPAAT